MHRRAVATSRSIRRIRRLFTPYFTPANGHRGVSVPARVGLGAKTLAEFSKASMAAQAGKSWVAVFPVRLVELVWQSVPAIQMSSWQLCRVMKVGLGPSMICAVRAVAFFVRKTGAKRGRE